jgi:hypothetical protein
MKPWHVGIAVAALAFAWMARWSEPVTVGNGAALTRDRFTGQLWFVLADGMRPVRPEASP